MASDRSENATGRSWAGLGTRTAAALVIVPLAFAAAWLGGIWFSAMLALIGVIAASEWCAMVHPANTKQVVLHASAGGLAGLGPVFLGLPVILALLLVIWLAALALDFSQRRALSVWWLAGVPYIALPLLMLVLLRADASHGLVAIVWLFAVVGSADTFAYFAGKSIGGPKLMPKVSPNKTWAGLAGAVSGGFAAALLVAHMAGLQTLLVLGLLGAFFAIVEQGGDLFESAAKRRHGVKDSGTLIPGHGGVLDRTDGLLAAALIAGLLGMGRTGIERAASGLLIW